MKLTRSSLIAVSAFAAVGFMHAASADGAGRVLSAEGAVSIQRGSTTVSARDGSVLSGGDVLSTGADGRVMWQTPDESLISLGGNSRLVVEAYSFDGNSGDARYNLKSGGVGVISGMIKSPGYKLSTTAGDVTVAGSKFKSMICAGNCADLPDGLYVVVTEPSVTVSNSAGSLTADAGQAVYAANSSTAPVLTAVPGIFASLKFDVAANIEAERIGNFIERPVSPSAP
jgi:hypothetical protein